MPQQSWMEQSHVDISALAQRVTGLEAGVLDIRGAIGDLAKKLDAKPTNWFGLASALAAVLLVIGAAIGFLIAPINSDLARHQSEIARIADTAVNRADYMRDRDETERWLGALRDRQRFNEDRGVFKDDLDRLEKVVAKIADNAASKSDLAEGARREDERLSSIAAGLNELRHDFYMNRTLAQPQAPVK